jgi:nucleoside-diphosphate-sugar epimerase
VKVLVTGAEGFVGQHLIRKLLEAEHQPIAACRPGTSPPPEWTGSAKRSRVPMISLELESAQSVRDAMSTGADAIVHLAAVSYSRDASKDPGQAWNINAGGTARILAALNQQGRDPLVIVASSAEVYGKGTNRPRRETEPPSPMNVYGATKLGTEIAAAQAINEWGMPVIVVRPFPATGPGYQENRVLSKWIDAILAGKEEVEGDPTVVRDFVDVRDVADAYESLLARGHAGETYNIATGRAVTFGQLIGMVAAKLHKRVRLVPPAEPRSDAPHLVGNPGKIRRHTGWQAAIPLDRTLSDLIDAQAN